MASRAAQLRDRWRAHARLQRFERAYSDVDVRDEKDELHANADFIRFIASDPGWLNGAFERLRPTSSDVFLDLGCGKGSALLLAAEQPFARVIGVELVPRLAAIARLNLEHSTRPRRAGAVEVVVADAAAYEIPADVSIAYMFSPFIGGTLTRVAQNLIASHDRHPRPLNLVYACPHGESTLLATGGFETVERFVAPAPAGVRSDVAIFRVVGAQPAEGLI